MKNEAEEGWKMEFISLELRGLLTIYLCLKVNLASFDFGIDERPSFYHSGVHWVIT
jgi:hypothetical protein